MANKSTKKNDSDKNEILSLSLAGEMAFRGGKLYLIAASDPASHQLVGRRGQDCFGYVVCGTFLRYGNDQVHFFPSKQGAKEGLPQSLLTKLIF